MIIRAGEQPAVRSDQGSWQARELLEDEALLVQKLGELGARGGAAGGGLAGGISGLVSGALGGRAGGRAGARWMSRRLRVDSAELTLDLAASTQRIVRAATDILRDEGEVTEGSFADGDEEAVRGVVGAGALSMNPAVVRVHATPLGAEVSRVSVRALAKEGLIKQRAGQDAAVRIRDHLTKAFPTWPRPSGP